MAFATFACLKNRGKPHLQEREGWGTLKALSPLGRLRQRALAMGCRRGSRVAEAATESFFALPA